MDFKQLLSMVQSPPEGIMPDGIFDDLQAAYDNKPDMGPELEEMTKARDALQMKFDDLTGKFAGAQDKISELVNKNYEMLQSLGSAPSPGGGVAGVDNNPGQDAGPGATSDPQAAIDNLFTPKEK